MYICTHEGQGHKSSPTLAIDSPKSDGSDNNDHNVNNNGRITSSDGDITDSDAMLLHTVHGRKPKFSTGLLVSSNFPRQPQS